MGRIPIGMDELTFEGKIVDISSVNMTLTSDEKVNVEHFISEKTYRPNTLKF